MTNEEHTEVAKAIIAQMGGRPALKLMINAHDFLALDNAPDGGLRFTFSGGEATHCEIRCRLDEYDMRLYRKTPIDQVLNGAEPIVTVFETAGIPDVALKGVFEEATGLCLTVPRIIFR